MLLPHMSSFKKDNDSDAVTVFLGSTRADLSLPRSARFSREELAWVDPNLPALIDYLVSEGQTRQEGCQRLWDSLSFWATPGPPLDVIGRYVRHLGRCNAITDVDDTEQYVKVHAMLYLIDTLQNGAPFVCGGCYKQMTLQFDWMEQHYPGSINRIRAAQALDYSPRDLANIATTVATPSTQQAALPDMGIE